MSQRKLLQEIDKVFKKVKEGLEIFDGYYEKLQGCESQSQKEKLEGDLKREIKKLQRQRDQIKNWLSGNDVKDKKQLLENRKLIENAMERFKVVEKNMKTKAFSKEGLSMERIDPKEKEKNESSEFIHQMLEELERQVEKHEAEIDQIQTSSKKGKKIDSSKQSQITELQEKIERNHWHEEKLEQILRLLANDDLECEQINALQEDIRYYVESNEDADFMEDDTIYDELNLEDAEEAYGNIGDFPQANNAIVEDQEAVVTPKKVFVPPIVTTTPAVKPASTSTSTTPILSVGPSNLKPSIAPKTELKYASVISAAQNNNSTSTSSTPALSHPSIVPAAIPPPPVESWSSTVLQSQENHSNSNINININSTPIQSHPTLAKAVTPKVESPSIPQEYSTSILQDLIPNFEKLKEQIYKPLPLEQISKTLENSLLNCPDSLDSEKPKVYQPAHPHPTSIYYPQEPTPELFYSSIISKFDVSTLFYIFYYHQGEYIQLLSAKELVKKGWKFDTNTSKWYLKSEANQPPSFVSNGVVNSEKEAIWKYFDNEGVWLPRRKDEFDVNSVEFATSF